MKKTYVRPVLYHESFQAAQYIANNCAEIVKMHQGVTAGGYGDMDEAYGDLGGTCFQDGVLNCNIHPDLIGQDQYCYMKSTGGNVLFTS